MSNNTERLLTESMGISKKVYEHVLTAESQVTDYFAAADDIMAYNQYKVLDVFQNPGSLICILAGIPATDTMTREERLWKRFMLCSSGRKPHW